MKQLRQTALLALALAFILALTACGMSDKERLAEIAGVWDARFADTESQARMLLENVDLYEEEIALADLTTLSYVKQVEFREDMTYAFSIAPASTRDCVEEYYRSTFALLYAGRAALDATYADTGVQLSSLGEAEFQQFYADLYGYPNFEALITAFADDAYDYESLSLSGENLSGTFAFDGNDIIVDKRGNVETVIRYERDAERDLLTLSFEEGVEVYSRAG